MAQEPTTVDTRAPNGKFVNPREVVFPFDEFGFTTMLRKEGVRAIGRIKGDKRKLEVFLQTLRVLGEHSKMKIEDQHRALAQADAAAKNREAAQFERSLADQKAEVSRLKRMLASAEAAVKAKEAMPGQEDE